MSTRGHHLTSLLWVKAWAQSKHTDQSRVSTPGEFFGKEQQRNTGNLSEGYEEQVVRATKS